MPATTRRTLLAASLAAPAILTRRADAAEFTYKFATNQPLGHPSNIHAQQAIDAIQKESSGRLAIQLFPNNQLGGDTDMFSQIRAGAIQFFPLSGLIVQTVVPTAGANGVGFAFKDYATVWAAMDGDFGAYIRKQMESAGLYTFPKIWDNGFRQVTSGAKPIKAPDDFKGFKIRVPVMPIEVSLFQSFGAAPTGININEAYSALQTHLVDGAGEPARHHRELEVLRGSEILLPHEPHVGRVLGARQCTRLAAPAARSAGDRLAQHGQGGGRPARRHPQAQ